MLRSRASRAGLELAGMLRLLLVLAAASATSLRRPLAPPSGWRGGRQSCRRAMRMQVDEGADWHTFRADLVAKERGRSPSQAAAAGTQPGAAAGDWWAHELAVPEPGCLLLASPHAIFAHQPLLRRSVVLVLEHDDVKARRRPPPPVTADVDSHAHATAPPRARSPAPYDTPHPRRARSASSSTRHPTQRSPPSSRAKTTRRSAPSPTISCGSEATCSRDRACACYPRAVTHRAAVRSYPACTRHAYNNTTYEPQQLPLLPHAHVHAARTYFSTSSSTACAGATGVRCANGGSWRGVTRRFRGVCRRVPVVATTTRRRATY